jgi:trk system potassium uptake protein TrkA
MVHPDVEAAEAIVHAVESGAIGNVINFENTDLQIARISVGEKSSLDGVQLKNIRSISQIKFLVAYVEQDGKTSLASGDTVISANCTLGILVDKNDIPEVLKLCGSEQKELKKVALIGAGRIGTLIAERLISSSKKLSFSGFFAEYSKKHSQKFVIIDNDEILAKNAAEKFPSAKVFNADATDENFLQEEGITNFDLAICATHNHELNMVLASYLESLGVKQSISLVTSAAYSSISQKLGIDVSIPLRDCVIDSIMSHLRGKSVKEIHTVTNGQLEIVECEVTLNSKANGKYLKEIADPGKFLVLMNKLSGTSEYKISNGNTKLSVGDNVVLITVAEESKKILSYFSDNED